MDPIVIEAVGGILAGAMIALMIVPKSHFPAILRHEMPVLQVRKAKKVARVSGRKALASQTAKRATASSPSKRRAPKTKTVGTPVVVAQVQPSVSATTTIALEACPSCGLQPPGSLPNGHFIGSPSQRNGPPKEDSIVAVQPGVASGTEEEISKESVRSLLQMLVPPRAFGRRHAHRSVSPISPIV